MSKNRLVLTESQKKVLFPAIASFVLLAAFSYVVSHSMAELNLLRRGISEANRKAAAIEQLTSLSEKEKDILKAFPMVKDKNNVIREVAGWAREQGIEVAAIDPKEEVLEGTNFVKLTLALDAKGGYQQVLQFIKKIETAPYFLLPTVIKLNGFDLEKRRYSSYQSDDVIDKKVQLDISVFMVS